MDRSSLLKTGTTQPLCKDSGEMPCLREMLNMKRRGFLIMSKTDLTLISSRPSPLFGFEVVKAFSSSGREMLEPEFKHFRI